MAIALGADLLNAIRSGRERRCSNLRINGLSQWLDSRLRDLVLCLRQHPFHPSKRQAFQRVDLMKSVILIGGIESADLRTDLQSNRRADPAGRFEGAMICFLRSAPPPRNLGVSVITINRTWDDLERDGYIYTTPGKGTFVNQLNPKQIHDKRILILKDKLVADLVYYKNLGIKKEDIEKIAEEVFGAE
ncbi:MAG: hypothetical protein MZU97_06140 [Bacillus subtilis]|nr:hypothetical protein [Bacillus subtilis]